MRKQKASFGNILLEIFIVIIGISIAFWVNNWGEQRKKERMEEEFIRTLQSDLKADSASFVFQMTTIKVNIRNLEGFMNLCRRKDFNNDSLSWYGRKFLNRMNWIVTSNTFDVLQSSGQLDIIEDFDLRNQISFFYELRTFQTDEILKLNQEFLDNHMYVYLTKNTDFFINRSPQYNFAKDLEFQNLLGRWYILKENKLDIYERTLSDINELLPKLEVYLE